MDGATRYARVIQMNWTKNKPTVPGWYWINGPGHCKEIVFVSRDSFGLIIQYVGLDIIETPDQYPEDYWYGPITPPELPKE